MATIKIGGKDLEVKQATVGFWLRTTEFGRKAASGELQGPAVIAASVGLILEAVGHNDGATREWLENNLPFPPTAEYGEVLEACGLVDRKAPPAGEAKTQ
jgi:hypothetical protein